MHTDGRTCRIQLPSRCIGIKKIKKFGFSYHRQAKGSHEIWYNEETNRFTTIPNHPGDIPIGTMYAILKQSAEGLIRPVADIIMKHKQVQKMLPEYDFSKGIRGKFARRFKAGTNMIVPAPDVAKMFSDPDAVNETLPAMAKIALRSKKRQNKPATISAEWIRQRIRMICMV